MWKPKGLLKFSYKDSETLVESECLSVRWLLLKVDSLGLSLIAGPNLDEACFVNQLFKESE